MLISRSSHHRTAKHSFVTKNKLAMNAILWYNKRHGTAFPHANVSLQFAAQGFRYTRHGIVCRRSNVHCFSSGLDYEERFGTHIYGIIVGMQL